MSFKLVIFPLVLLVSSASNAETLDDLNSCAEQKVPARRLVCFDDLVIKANKEFREKIVRNREEAANKAIRDREEAEKKATRDREEAANKAIRDREEAEKKATRDREEVEKQAKQKEIELRRAENEKIIAAARKMLSALKRIETRVETGVSYRDYPSIVSDADYEVRQFSSEYGPKLPQVGLGAVKVIADYQYVLSVWKIKFNQTSPSGRRPNEWVWEASQIQAVLSAYPSAISARLSDGTLSIDRVLSIVWAEASSKIKDVERALTEASSAN